MNEFGKTLGYKTNDEIVSINGVEVSMGNAKEVMDNYKKNTNSGDKVEVVVARKSGGEYKNKKLKAKAVVVENKKKYLIKFDDNATAEQLALRKAWLGQ